MMEDGGQELRLAIWRKSQFISYDDQGERVFGRYLKVREIDGMFSLESDSMSSFGGIKSVPT